MVFLRVRLLTKHGRHTRSSPVLLHAGLQVPPRPSPGGPERILSWRRIVGLLHVVELGV